MLQQIPRVKGLKAQGTRRSGKLEVDKNCHQIASECQTELEIPPSQREHLPKYLIRKGRKFSFQRLNGPSGAIVVRAAISSYRRIWGIRLAKGIGQRRHKRIKVVLPVRISGKDAANNPVNELAHTLDITPNGARLGAIHHVLKTGDKLMLQYRQRRIQFRVVWVKPLVGTNEFQVGLEGLSNSGENWGLELPEADVVDEYQNSATS